MLRGLRSGLRRSSRAWLAALLPALVACGPVSAPHSPGGGAARIAPDGGLAGDVRVAIRLPEGGPPDFNALPWPSELFRADDGSLDWRGFPGALHPLLAQYFASAKADVLDFSIAPTIYFHFTATLDRGRLAAAPEATLSLRSPFFLVDVDPKSPERGSLVPLESQYHPISRHYIRARTLALKPVAGMVLRPGTLYAAVLRRDLGDKSAPLLGTTPDFENIKSPRALPGAAAERARSIHAEAFDYLTSLGVARDEIAAAALFRTGVPHAVAERLFESAMALPPHHAPRLVEASWAPPRKTAFAERRPYSIIFGYYCTPSFQSGLDDAPFLSGGGTLDFDERRSPRVVPIPESSRYRTAACGELLRARFILTIPKTPMPEGGYPLLVTAHGTGGSATSFLGEDNFAGWAAREGIAAVSTDQPLHGGEDPEGARPGSRERGRMSIAGIPLRLFRGHTVGPELAFYNPLNPAATRDNLRQAGIDASLLARLLIATDFATATEPEGDAKAEPKQKSKQRQKPKQPSLLLAPIPGQAPPRFDKTKILFAGHSQGSQSLAVEAALDPLARGVILSGCGGDARLGIVRRRDLTIMPFIETALALDKNELDDFHPLMALVQLLIDPVDPQSFARLYREPLPGRRPQSALHYGGLSDTYTPPETASALAAALRAAPLAPLLTPVRSLRMLGITPTQGSLRGNLAGGKATAAFVQLAPTQGEDGHFVLFAEPPAADIAMQFMRTALAPTPGPAEVGPLPTEPPPADQ